MEQLTEKEKSEALADFERKQRRQLSTGRFIVFSIAVINIILVIIDSFISFSLLRFILNLTLSVLLIFGVSWARYIFAVSYGLSALGLLYAFFTSIGEEPVPTASVLYIVLYSVFGISCCLLLFLNKCVSEFLYRQKNG